MARQAVLGEVEFAMTAARGRTARTVVQTVRAARVTLARHAGKTCEVTVILAREEAPPAGEKPVEWLLLTNEPVTTLDDAVLRIGWYRRRWLAEIFVRILEGVHGSRGSGSGRAMYDDPRVAVGPLVLSESKRERRRRQNEGHPTRRQVICGSPCWSAQRSEGRKRGGRRTNAGSRRQRVSPIFCS